MRSFTPRKSYSKESSGGCCNFHHTFRVVFKFEMKGFSFLVHISSGGSRNQLMGGLFRLLFFFLHKNGGGLKERSIVCRVYGGLKEGWSPSRPTVASATAYKSLMIFLWTS